MAEILSGAREASTKQEISADLYKQITEQLLQLSQSGELTIEFLDAYQKIANQIIDNNGGAGRNISSKAMSLTRTLGIYRAGLREKNRSTDPQL